MTRQYRKSPRIRDFDYLGPLAVHVILVTQNRQPLFSDADRARRCIACLNASIGKHLVTVHAYCLMPDHLHLLLEVPEGVSLESVVHSFKTRSGYELRQGSEQGVWQTSYYDHILRKEEALGDVAKYIWANPVTAGFVSEARNYEWSGPHEALAQA